MYSVLNLTLFLSCFHDFSVPQKKVIIRQGHIAENFYFLITGAGN